MSMVQKRLYVNGKRKDYSMLDQIMKEIEESGDTIVECVTETIKGMKITTITTANYLG